MFFHFSVLVALNVRVDDVTYKEFAVSYALQLLHIHHDNRIKRLYYSTE